MRNDKIHSIVLALIFFIILASLLQHTQALEKKKDIDWHNGSGLPVSHSDIDWQGKFLDKHSIEFLKHFNYNTARKYSSGKSNPQQITLQFKNKKDLTFDASSTFHKNYNLKFAIDGNPKSYWLSQKSNNPHWIMMDFGRKRLFDRLILRLGRHNHKRTIKKYHVQFFYQGTWFDYMKVDLTSKPAIENDFRYLGGIDASKIRIYIPKDGTYNGFSAVREIELYLGKSLVMHFDPRLMGFTIPIENGLLPDNDYLYPNAPRAYRGGTHAGIDITHFYDPNNNFKVRPLSKEIKILATRDGVIIRADHNYIPRTKDEYEAATRHWQKNNRTFVLRSFGGRQVWIDHENGVLTTYNHLSMILPSVHPGMKIKKGDVIGYAGNSGLRGESYATGDQIHLHFEIWVDGEFLGKGMPVKDIKKLFSWMFTDFQ